MRKITADIVYPVNAAPIKNGVVTIDDNGEIVKIETLSEASKDNLEKYDGLLVPGFVNTHCHLELSHMKGKVDTGTGLIPFISAVVQFRDIDPDEIQEAIKEADEFMYDAGVMAVGDISNTKDTVAQKSTSKIKYYTFVEMFDFLNSGMTDSEFDKYIEVYHAHEDNEKNQKTVVPHAPYTVTKRLFEKINEINSKGKTVSIHNQETPPENELFESGTGGFKDFYEGFNMPLNDFEATQKPSIYYALDHMNPDCKALFVHNTLTTRADIEAAQSWNENTYWATCPNANLYIENRLPNYQAFLDTKAKLTIGTDSLTSNWQLSVFEEMKTIARYQSYVPFQTLLRWATLNGAEALSFDNELGSLEPGKKPGLVLLENVNEENWMNAKIKRIA